MQAASHMRKKHVSPIVKLLFLGLYQNTLRGFPPPTSSPSGWLERDGAWWFWVGPPLGLAKWVPRGEAHRELTITTAASSALKPPQRLSLCTTGSSRLHYRSWRSKSSQLYVVIASSFACVASDVLGPAAEAHTAELTLFYTHTRKETHTRPDYTHTQHLRPLPNLWKQPKLPHQRTSLESMRVCFHLNLNLVSGTAYNCCVAISWITWTHSQTYKDSLL